MNDKKTHPVLFWTAIGVAGYGVLKRTPWIAALGFGALIFSVWRDRTPSQFTTGAAYDAAAAAAAAAAPAPATLPKSFKTLRQ